MRIGSSVFLIALGAILTFAVEADIPYISLDLVGYILMIAGVIGLVWALLASNRTRTTETRVVNDPATGETVRRSESSEGI
jgi:hypothetical protein